MVQIGFGIRGLLASDREQCSKMSNSGTRGTSCCSVSAVVEQQTGVFSDFEWQAGSDEFGVPSQAVKRQRRTRKARGSLSWQRHMGGDEMRAKVLA